jgi:methionyl-tRNA formyltransferase
MATILVATTKPWNIKAFAELKGSDPDWHLITSKGALNREYLFQLDPDWIFFPHWSWVVNQGIYKQWNCVVFHTAPLPKYRGGSVFQHQIMDGEAASEICAVKMVQELDAGPVYSRKHLSLQGSMQEIFEKFAVDVYGMMNYIIAVNPTPIPQEGEPTVYRRRTPAESRIPSLIAPIDAYNHIRALDARGYPNSFIEYSNLRLEFRGAKLVTNDVVEATVRITKR